MQSKFLEFLKIINLKKTFGGISAIDNLNFSVNKNIITSIIGPNGAGKTTLFNLITGFIKPNSGNILFCDREISSLPAHKIAFAGIARTFQNIQIFSNMTILENTMIGRHTKSFNGIFSSFFIPPFFRQEEKKIKQEALNWLEFVNIKHDLNASAVTLPLGSQRILEIARALAMEPKLLLLDEPASGLNSRETIILGKLIKKIKEIGITVILIEHDVELVMDISDEIIVMNFGKCLAKGSPIEIQTNPAVISAYLGE